VPPTTAAIVQPEVIVDDASRESAMPIEDVSDPIQALPAADQLDMSVLDSLPATMRLELMREYGMHSFGAQRSTRSKSVTIRGKASTAASRAQGGGLEGSLKRIQEAGKSSRKKQKGPKPFQSIFVTSTNVPQVKNAAVTTHPSAQSEHFRSRHQGSVHEVCFCSGRTSPSQHRCPSALLHLNTSKHCIKLTVKARFGCAKYEVDLLLTAHSHNRILDAEACNCSKQ
jgi:hypothetical protein